MKGKIYWFDTYKSFQERITEIVNEHRTSLFNKKRHALQDSLHNKNKKKTH